MFSDNICGLVKQWVSKSVILFGHLKHLQSPLERVFFIFFKAERHILKMHG